jgi:hypothetical protein
MVWRTGIIPILFTWIFIPAPAKAQPGDRSLDMKARVLDAVFPLDISPKPYLLKMILRFGDSDSQVVVAVYPDKEKYWVRRCEITSYTLAGMDNGQLSQLISKMTAQNPNATPQEIAAKLKVDIRHSDVKYETLTRILNQLKAIRISPVLVDRVTVDSSDYEYWYDNWQEAVHYTIAGQSGITPQDRLAQWMISFRARLPDLMRPASASERSK